MKAEPSKRRAARNATLPERLSPQLAQLVAEPPRGEGWIHELKLDGYRILARRDGDEVRLVSRRGEDWTERFAPVARSVARLPVDRLLLDGEVVLLDENGVPDFQALQNVMSEGRVEDLVYFVFDLLHLDGRDLTATPLVERKAALARVVAASRNGSTRLRLSDHVTGQGAEFLEKACELGLEGIVSKRAADPYRPGRGPGWLKTKCRARQELVIGGFTDPSGSRSGFGALLLGVHDGGNLRYSGKVGTGFTEKTIRDLEPKLRAREIDRPPFANPPKGAAARGVHWIRPELVAEVEFAGWTKDAILRAPAFKGLRGDKPAREIVREMPRSAPAPTSRGVEKPRARGKTRDAIEIAGIRLTHPDRVIDEPSGITKEALARYYEAVADRMLPHLAGRPLTLLRCPQGAGKQCFYQRHVGAGMPAAIHRVKVREKKGEVLYPMVDTIEGLIGLVQMGVLEIHPWGARIEDLEHPDRLFFDLDPAPDTPWKNVVDTARLLRKELGDIESYVKTTGGKGLHVVAAIPPKAAWSDITKLTRTIAEDLVRRFPDRYVATAAKKERTGKIYIDYLRNTRSATAVAAYSSRARPGATVSMPVAWEELGKIRPDAFTVESVPALVKRRRRDPWKGFDE